MAPPFREFGEAAVLLKKSMRWEIFVRTMRKGHMKGKALKPVSLRAIISVACFAIGLFLFLYPLLSNAQYDAQQKADERSYDEAMSKLSSDTSANGSSNDISEMFDKAREYNATLLNSGTYLTDPFDESKLADPTQEPYADLLNPDGSGLMGYLDIPKIDVNLPIYHGTTSEVLSAGVGHLQPTSLPVGGRGTHAVLSAHTGVAGKKLFTDLDQLRDGDTFYIHVLGKVLAYRVEDIRVVLPDDVSTLKIDTNADKVTLVTCTPYGVNDHRLLVTGSRTKYDPQEANASAGVPVTSTNWFMDYLRAVLIWIVVLVAALVVRHVRHTHVPRHLSR